MHAQNRTTCVLAEVCEAELDDKLEEPADSCPAKSFIAEERKCRDIKNISKCSGWCNPVPRCQGDVVAEECEISMDSTFRILAAAGSKDAQIYVHGSKVSENCDKQKNETSCISVVPQRTFKQSVTTQMSCTDVNKMMANEKKAETAFKVAFEKTGGVAVNSVSLSKVGCTRRLHTGSRLLSTTKGIKADFEYTAAVEATVDGSKFTQALKTELVNQEMSVTLAESTATKATDVTPTNTKETSSAQATALLFVSSSLMLLAHAWC